MVNIGSGFSDQLRFDIWQSRSTIVGELAESVAFVAQIVWSVPALASAGFEFTMMLTVSDWAKQFWLEMVQLN